MPLIKIAVGVGSVVAGIYLTSVFGQSTGTGSYHSYGFRRYNASIPAALVVFCSQKVLANASDDINSATFAIGRNPKDYGAYLKRGDGYWTKSMMNEALTDYTSAIAISPMSPDAYDKRAIIYDALGQSDQANKDRESAKLYRK